MQGKEKEVKEREKWRMDVSGEMKGEQMWGGSNKE